jgi:UDP-3-O-[3-hydroxymyristoyl] glucosamine N-acyltransferase
VTVREHSVLGDRCVVHCGAVIGSDGFGYTRKGMAWEKIPQTGTVEIGNDVEIGANATIDRARFGRTVIEDGVKLDNLVQIAHNVRVGAHTAMAAFCGVAGSTVLGKGCQLGGQVGVGGHLTVGDGVVAAAKSGITKDAKPNSVLFGMPAADADKARRLHAMVARLPALKERLAELAGRVDALEARLSGDGRTAE